MKPLLPLFILFSNILLAQSPILLGITDMPTVGTTQKRAIDTLNINNINYGNAGANQVYDFSHLAATKYDTVHYNALTNPQQAYFTNANMAITTDSISYTYVRLTGAAYDIQGLEGKIAGGNLKVANFPVNYLYIFDVNYADNFNGTWGFQTTVTGAPFGTPQFSQVRVTYTVSYWDTIDGWGKTITPVGAYNSLRQKRKEYSEMKVETSYSSSGGSFHIKSLNRDTTIFYSYLSEESKGELVGFEYDSSNNVKGIIYSLATPPPPVANYTDTNTMGGLVQFTSIGNPNSYTYSWDFGDGDTSNQINPYHLYPANGSYYVCLTVTNSGGSDTYCDSVYVTELNSGINNAPWSVDDFLGITQATTSSNSITDNDFDPDNDSICVSSVWGSSFTLQDSSNVCNSIIYQPDSSFTGYDTAYYSLCDNGTPVLCDTAMIVFYVAADLTLYPKAINDTISIMQLNDTTITVTINDTIGSTDNGFCISTIYGGTNFNLDNCNDITYSPDSTFTGNDTAYYIVCDNGLPTLCDTAMLVVTSNQNLALTPVASFSSPEGFFECGGLYPTYLDYLIISSTTNSTSNVWHFSGIDNITSPCDSFIYNQDTVYFNPIEFTCNWEEPMNYEVCLTATNSFGTSTKCDTICSILWEGINEVSLSNIQLYPNPANSYITIDMHNNQDGITRNYQAIEVYNVLGEKVKSIGKQSTDKVMLNINGLPQGMYVATITGSNGERRTLGRFTVE